jgi:hypothetical protein
MALFFLSSAFTLSIRLSIYRPQPFLSLHYRFTFPRLPRLSFATFLNVFFWFVDSYPGLILLLLLFLVSV